MGRLHQLALESFYSTVMWNRITVLLLVASFAIITTHSATLTREECYPRFESWLVEHGKMYKVAGEKELRFQIYFGNVIHIEKHNSKNPLFTLKLNRFADLALDEYTTTYEGTTTGDPRRKGSTESLKSDRYSFAPTDVLPESVDWREKGAVAAIKDQGTCGGSWAFSPIGSVEAFHYITTGELITLSEQQLLDCDTSCNKGCNGGDKDHAFAFIVGNGGIDTDTDYPYTGRDERCYAFTKKRKAGWIDGDEGLLANHNMRRTVCIDGYEGVPANDELSLQKAVANQPISVSIAAGSTDFQFYSGGIFNGKCGDRLDHAVLVVGYGTEAGKDYWLVRNSWGRDWGEQGYMRIERNVKEKTGKCGIAMEPLYPIKNGQNPPSPDAGSLHPNPVTSQPQQLCKEGSNACGNVVTILSLDGGGIRAIIPLVILDFLETLIQESLGENVKLADVFDVIAGTSTGGLVTAMLTVPNKDGRPMYTIKEILKLYIEEGPKIFPPGSNHPLAFPAKVIKALWGPKYDGEHLRKVIREKLQDKQLGETTTKAVITTFDIKTMQPVIFSSFQVEINPSTNVKLSDIVIATSAAPTYLPSHWFHYIDPKGNVREFNLIDGGVVANNPLLVAITEVIVEKTRQDPTWSATDYQFLVLSLGTGCPEFKEKYNAKKSSSWGILGWLCSGGSAPLLDVFSSGYSEMADYLASVLLEALNSKDLYLRIQETALEDDMASLDLATKENLKNLAATGEKLLKKPVTMKNAATGELEHDPNVTNEMAIRRLAVALQKIYCARKKKSEMDKEV